MRDEDKEFNYEEYYNNQDIFDEQADEIEPEIEVGGSKVASAPGKNIAVTVLLVLAVAGIIYYYFFMDDSASPKQPELPQTPASQISEPPEPSFTTLTPSIPELPEPPKLVPPTPPAPPAPPILQPQITVEAVPPTPAEKILQQEATPSKPENVLTKDQRRKSNMIVSGGTGSSGGGAPTLASLGGAQVPSTTNTPFDPNYSIELTSAPTAKATSIGNPRYVIAQGKMIDAVLESAINTDVPGGSIRAVVTRDVYSEYGKNVLIPKGSRLIGRYADSQPVRGQVRIAASWTRVILPNGIDINMESPYVDRLGRSGATGNVDNKYFEVLGNALLLSIVKVGFAKFAEELNDSSITTSQTQDNATGTTTTTSTATPTGSAIIDAVDDLGTVVEGLVESYLNAAPTITIDQGTQLKVFVQQDIVFPLNYQINGKVIQ